MLGNSFFSRNATLADVSRAKFDVIVWLHSSWMWKWWQDDEGLNHRPSGSIERRSVTTRLESMIFTHEQIREQRSALDSVSQSELLFGLVLQVFPGVHIFTSVWIPHVAGSQIILTEFVGQRVQLGWPHCTYVDDRWLFVSCQTEALVLET